MKSSGLLVMIHVDTADSVAQKAKPGSSIFVRSNQDFSQHGLSEKGLERASIVF